MIRVVFLILIFCSTSYADLQVIGSIASQGGTSGCNNTIKDSETTETTNNTLFFTADRQWVANRWTTGSAYDLCKIEVSLRRQGTVTFNINAYIYSESGNAPNTLLATSTTTVDASTIGTSFEWVEFDFSSAPLSLSNATQYWIVLKSSTIGDGSNLIRWAANATGEFFSKSSDGSSWTGVNNTGNNFRAYD